jgi:hypothetical protein
MKVDPMAVVFYKVGLPENTVHEVDQTGSYEINLKHRPGFRFDKPKTHSWDYRHQRHLSSLKGGGFYRSEGEADREVYKHMLRIEGFEQRDGAYYESPAMARARTKVPQGVSQGDVGGTAQESSSARPVPLGRPLAEGPKIVHGISASNNSELKRYAELAFRTRSLGGGNNGRGISNQGRRSTGIKAKRAAAETQREGKRRQCEAFRVEHITRLHAVLKSGDLGSIVVSSPDLEALNEGQPLPLSEKAAGRLRVQAVCVAIFYSVIGERHACSLDDSGESLSLVECRDLAAERTGFQVAGSTIYHWHLEYMENGGKFERDNRGTYERVTFIRDHPDLLGKLNLFMTQHLHLTKAIATEFVNKTLIPENVCKGDPFAMAQTLDLYGLKYTISDDTVLRWMHEAGGENKSREKTYMHDKHEADEVRAYRKEYVHRDLGTSARDPSDRNMRQHHWVQMTRAKADEMTKACSPAHREHLWSIAHTYTATTAAAKGSVGADGIASAAAAAAYTKGAVVRYEAAVDESDNGRCACLVGPLSPPQTPARWRRNEPKELLLSTRRSSVPQRLLLRSQPRARCEMCLNSQRRSARWWRGAGPR